MGVDMFGVVVDIPHRQYLGETSAAGDNQFPTVYRWLAEHTLLGQDEFAAAMSTAGVPG
jgi:hypothetical protein